MRTIALALILAAALSFSAHAVDYHQVQTDQSAITFNYQQMGVTMDGKFSQFTAQMNFDPNDPTAAKVVVDVNLASIDTGFTEGDEEVIGEPWLNTAKYPTARFVASKVEALGGNRYQVTGQLTIKGKTRDVVIPATFTTQDQTGVFDGDFTLNRADFAIGEGTWSAFDVVANEIQIQFRIVALSSK